MNRRPERLADLLPGVVAELAARHNTTNGAVMTEPDDEPGTFVVDFEPGLYGPFKTRREATEWAYTKVALTDATTGQRGVFYHYVVRPVSAPAEPLGGAA